MQKYAKIINEELGLVEVGIGDPDAVWETETVIIEEPTEENPEGKTITITRYVRDFYESIGMELMEVEEAYNGAWYIAGKAPAPPETKTIRTFSKFSIWVATRNMPIEEGSSVMVWDAFEAFLHECQLWAGWNQLIDLVEDNPFFEQFYPIACEKLGKELVDKVLESSVSSTRTVTV
jgi:hypothetical protein